MATVFDVAKYILEQCGKMSTMKLQKPCYYCQAWSLAWTEKPLFNERFEAWVNGPVCPELFKFHKGKFLINAKDFTESENSLLLDDEKDTIKHVLEYYGSWEPYELREQTHSEEPWRAARNGIAADIPCDNEITMSSMGEYYGNL